MSDLVSRLRKWLADIERRTNYMGQDCDMQRRTAERLAMIAEAADELERLRAIIALQTRSIKEMLTAFREYEMDVDTSPPDKHQRMIQRANVAAEKASTSDG